MRVDAAPDGVLPDGRLIRPGLDLGSIPFFQQPLELNPRQTPLGGEPIVLKEQGAPRQATTPIAKAAAQTAKEIVPAAPKADKVEIAALELMLADPANKEMVEHFGGELKPLPTWTSNGKGIEARYGADLGGRLYQLQLAQRAVEGEFFQAMDDAQRSPPKDPLPDYHRPNQPVPTTDRPGWTYSAGGGHADDWQAPHWVYSKELFARQYAAGDSPAQRAFASLHGTDPIKFVPAADTETASQDSWQMSGLTVREGRPVDREDGLTPASSIVKDGWLPSGLERRDYHLDPNRITKLINNEAVWFDPVHGFSTDPDNLKPDALDRAMPYVFAAAVTAMTFGAGSTVAAGIASAAGGGASGTVAVGAAMGAVSNGAMQLAANGKINFGQLLQSAVAGGLTAGMTKLPGVGEYLDVGGKSFGGRLMAYTGRATVQGAIQAVAGGKFKDGFASGLMSGLAGEVTAQIDTQIGQMQGLSASEASALRLLSRATGSAMRLAGSKDPASGFASDFLGGLMHDGLAAHQPNTDAVGSAPPADPLGEFIADNQQVWADRQARYDQVLAAFANPVSTDRSEDVLVAAGPEFTGGLSSSLNCRIPDDHMVAC